MRLALAFVLLSFTALAAGFTNGSFETNNCEAAAGSWRLSGTGPTCTTGWLVAVGTVDCSNRLRAVSNGVHSAGTASGSQSIASLANGLTSYALTDELPATGGRIGVVGLESAGGGGLTGPGLHFRRFGAFTSVATNLHRRLPHPRGI